MHRQWTDYRGRTWWGWGGVTDNSSQKCLSRPSTTSSALPHGPRSRNDLQTKPEVASLASRHSFLPVQSFWVLPKASLNPLKYKCCGSGTMLRLSILLLSCPRAFLIFTLQLTAEGPRPGSQGRLAVWDYVGRWAGPIALGVGCL